MSGRCFYWGLFFFVVSQVRCVNVFALWNFRQASSECLRVHASRDCWASVDTAMLSIVPVVSFGLVQANYTAVCWFSLSDKKMAMGFALTTIKQETAFSFILVLRDPFVCMSHKGCGLPRHWPINTYQLFQQFFHLIATVCPAMTRMVSFVYFCHSAIYQSMGI